MVRAWSMRRAWSFSHEFGLYLDAMGQSLEVRRANFATWVTRALLQAKAGPRRLSVAAIAESAGVSTQAIYRWKNGTWEKEGPKPEQLVAFCDALDIPPAEAFSILWPSKNDRPQAPEAPPMDPDIQTVLRKLADPNVPAEEKYFLQESISLLAASATRPGRVLPKRKAS